ncbi:helix-turn-helix domain-containing protein [Microbacterium aurum]
MGLLEQLARHRRVAGVSAPELALRVGTHASNIYAIESGRRDARLSTVEALVAATDARLLIVDTGRRASAADTAETLRRDLDDAHRAQALVQLSSNLKSVGPLAKAALTTDPPLPLAPTWDAAIAGIVEHEPLDPDCPHRHGSATCRGSPTGAGIRGQLVASFPTPTGCPNPYAGEACGLTRPSW